MKIWSSMKSLPNDLEVKDMEDMLFFMAMEGLEDFPLFSFTLTGKQSIYSI
jgi:hypothetical protein